MTKVGCFGSIQRLIQDPRTGSIVGLTGKSHISVNTAEGGSDMGQPAGKAMSAWMEAQRQQELSAQQAYTSHLHAIDRCKQFEAQKRSPVNEAIKLRGVWMPVIPGETRIPKVGQ